MLKCLFGRGEGGARTGGGGGEGCKVSSPAGRPEAGVGGYPSLGNLLVIEGKGVGSDVSGADTGGFANAEEMCKGKEGKACGLGIGDGLHVVGQGDEEIWCGPKLGRCWRGQALKGFGKSPMKGGDDGREEGEGFQLPNGRDETTGTGGGTRAGDHVMEGGSEGFSVG